MNILAERITRMAMKMLREGTYDKTATPYLSKGDERRMLGNNPLVVDNGGHSAQDKILQPSTFDDNGENYRGETITLSKPEFFQYKKKAFGFEGKKLTMSELEELKKKCTKTLFGGDTKEWRKAVDTVNGGAKRGGKHVTWRFLTDGTSGRMVEFSLGGGNWFLLKPQPLQTMIASPYGGTSLNEMISNIVKKVLMSM